jgi:hypothetical protein
MTRGLGVNLLQIPNGTGASYFPFFFGAAFFLGAAFLVAFFID